MNFRLLQYKNSHIGYYKFGRGPEVAICFHGYGEDGGMYRFLEKEAGQLFTFYSIDLPFHGHTKWNEDLVFTHIDLDNIIGSILRENGSPIDDPLTLIGFSLGGRIALSLYQSRPALAKKLVLLAPDGLKVNFWYWLATQTLLGNKLFALTMRRPEWFMGFLRLVNKLGIVNASIFKFVNYYIGDSNIRDLLYRRWTALRKLRPNIQRIKTMIRTNHTPVRLVYGQHDRIILPSVGKKFAEGIEMHCSITIIHSGHQVLHEKHLNEILPALLH